MKTFLMVSTFVTLLSLIFLRPVLISAPSNEQGEVLSAFVAKPETPDINKIFDLVNVQRNLNNLQPLERSESLTSVAAQRANDMKNNNYYAHQSPKGQYYYDYLPSKFASKYTCENLDLQFSLNPNLYVNDWLSSKSHKNCLLNKVTKKAGYAVVKLNNEDPDQFPSYVVVAIHAE